MIKRGLFLLTAALVLHSICFPDTGPRASVMVFGPGSGEWGNYLFGQGLEARSETGAVLPVDKFHEYDAVMILSYALREQLAGEEVEKAGEYLKGGGSLIIFGGQPFSMAGGRDTSKLGWLGANFYGFKELEERVLDAEHFLTSHFDKDTFARQEGSKAYLGRVTTGRILVGTEREAVLLVNEYGDGRVVYLSPRNLAFYRDNEEWGALIKEILVSAGVREITRGLFPREELSVDEHTLFLSRFNDSLQADYARGNPLPSGNLGFADGRFGQGVRAGRGLIQQENVFSSPFFRMLRYDHQGNFDVEEGTLEMWVKPSFRLAKDLDEATADWGGNDYYLFHIAIAPGNRDIALYIREWMTEEGLRRKLAFRERWERDRSATFITEGYVNWDEEEWAHVAVTWDRGGKRAVFLNGRQVAGRTIQRKEYISLPTFGRGARPMAIGSMATYSARPAEAVIDDFRISDKVRY